MADDGRAIALSVRHFGFFASRFRMVTRSRFHTFAARLLPESDGVQGKRPRGRAESVEASRRRAPDPEA
jgi:hypothetical protein